MRLDLIIGSVTAAGFALVIAACGDETTTIGDSPADEDGGASSSSSSGSTSSSSGSTGSSSSSSSSGSTSSGGEIKPVELKAGSAILVGIADDQAIYLDEASALNAVPIAGGASVKIADIGQTDDFIVSGGAVGVYTAVTEGKGTLNIWTKAAGYKPDAAQASVVGIFAASSDGARVAFSAGANAATTSTPITVATAADPTTPLATLSGATVAAGQAMNLAAASAQPPTCSPDVSFVGQKLVASYCTGTNAAATAAKLWVVDGSTIKRVDAATGTGVVQPFWVADANATKLFALGLPGGGTPNEGRWINVATGAITPIEANTASAVMLEDGSAVVYRTTGNALKKATTAVPPAIATVVAADVRGLLGSSPDQKKVLYRTLDPAQGLTDIRLVDHTAVGAKPVDIVATAAAINVGFTAPSLHVGYVTEPGAMGAKLKAKPVAGGAEKELATGVFGAFLPSEGTSAVMLTNRKQVMVGQQNLTFFELKTVGAVAGGTPVSIATDVPQGLYAFKDKTLVYSRLVPAGGAGSGLYSAVLP